jgi:penicillin-binding protein 1C
MGRNNWRRKVDILKLSKWGKWWKATVFITVAFLLLIVLVPLPRPLFNGPYATTLRASNGQLLSAAIASDQQWRFAPADSIPYKFAVAMRIYEDEYFFYHPGINPVSIARALRQNISAGKIVSGGSTLSMQTVRMAYKNKPRTYSQKLLELLATLKLELFYSKGEIMMAYANNAPFGGNIVGLSAAAWRYYGRSPWQLSWAEAAALAVLPNSPSVIFPGKNENRFLAKRNKLLDKLKIKGFLDEDDLFLAKQESLPQKIKPFPNLAYHLLHRTMVENRGLNDVITTLNARLQKKVKQKVVNYSRELSGNQINNAAAIVIDITTGRSLAYVGNSENKGNHGQHVDIITARRSPGSLFKPILYALALDDGTILPNQLLPDIPLFYRGFAPQNFDKKYRGAVPASSALTSSLNVPFVHLLIEYGYERFHQKLKQMGMASLDQPAQHYGLSIILGGAETTLWEISSVYAGMARAYFNYPNRPFRSGYSADDYFPNSYLEANSMPIKPVLEEYGFVQAPSLGFTFRAMQQLNRPDQETGWQYFNSSTAIAWKTGTSFGLKDGWAIGITNKHVVGVWLGNADGEGRPGLTGVNTAAPLLFQLFELLDDEANFNALYGVDEAICKQSGMKAGPLCKDIVTYALPEYMTNSQTCSYHQLIHLNREQTYQVNSNCYAVENMQSVPWFILPPVQSWYYQKYHPNYRKLPPFAPNCLDTDGGSLFQLIYPRQFTKVFIPLEQDGQRGKVIFAAAHENKQAKLYWHLDDNYLGTTEGKHQMGIQTTKGLHTLTLVDDHGNELQQKILVVN